MVLDGERPHYGCQNAVCPTLTATKRGFDFFSKIESGQFIGKGAFSDKEIMQIGSYPLDYDFKGIEPKYLIGMSVPPVMTAQIANQIWEQWLSKIK